MKDDEDDVATLLAIAQQLAATATTALPPGLPALLYLSDTIASPDPVRVAQRLPAGCGVVFRHYDHPARARVAQALAHVCHARQLPLLIGADASLADQVGADGVHWPEALLPLQPARRHRLVTAAAHSVEGLRAALAYGCDAAIVSPVFVTQSHPEGRALGREGLRALAGAVPVAVFALGGIGARNAGALLGSGAAGIAAVRGFGT